MFKINLSPQVREDSISVSVSGSSNNDKRSNLRPLSACRRRDFAAGRICYGVYRIGRDT